MIELIQQIYSVLGVAIEANSGDAMGIASVLLILLASASKFFSKDDSKSEPRIERAAEEVKPAVEKSAPIPEEKEEPEVATEPKISWNERLKKGLGRSRDQVWGKIGGLFTGNPLTDDQVEELEELLYGADLGPKTTMELMDQLQAKLKSDSFSAEDFKTFLSGFIKEQMDDVQQNIDTELFDFPEGGFGKTKVIMIVGVNGAGKTTTIGKLATKLTAQGAKVVVGACDTFRAAAVDQLQVWCDRANATMIRAKEGANPSGVGYEALQTALNEKADYCLLDTAGRLHTKQNLMEELTKSKNVLKKLDPETPDHVLLVIDAITGQNALRQAKEFNQALGLSGLIFTKCDGSSKAGSAVSIVKELQVPITYIGVGESVEDLDKFNLDAYLNALLEASPQ
jgi:fused signal recognition particle receptor